MQRQPRIEEPAHLAHLRTLPCLVCGTPHSTEAAHVRYADMRIVKRNPGLGQKPHDYYCVPLCGDHHRDQHKGSERKFWQAVGMDPVLIALALYAETGNHERGCEIVNGAHSGSNILMAG